MAFVASLLIRTYSHEDAGVDDERETLGDEDRDKDDVEENVGSGEFKDGGLVGDIDEEERDNGLLGKNKLM